MTSQSFGRAHVHGFAFLLSSSFLDGTLAYCLAFPEAMNGLLSVYSLLAADVVTESRVPCAIPQFDYYTKVWIMIVAPFAVTLILVVGGILSAAWHRDRRKRKRITVTSSTLRKEKRRGAHKSTLKMGLWKASTYVLFMLDLLYPAITRTLPVMVLQRTFVD